MRVVGVAALMVVFLGCGSPDPGPTGGGGGGTGGGTGGGGGSGSACSAANCLGCCFNGACQSGNTAAACGKNGVACGACSAGSICDATQTCVLDPQSRWRLVPASGTFSSNGNWDVGGGAPDGMVFFWCPATASSTSLVTAEATDNFTPNYSVTTGSCIMTAVDLKNIGFAIEVDDVDVTTNDIAMSKSTIRLNDTHFSNGMINLATMDNSCTVRVTLTRQ